MRSAKSDLTVTCWPCAAGCWRPAPCPPSDRWTMSDEWVGETSHTVYPQSAIRKLKLLNNRKFVYFTKYPLTVFLIFSKYQSISCWIYKKGKFPLTHMGGSLCLHACRHSHSSPNRHKWIFRCLCLQCHKKASPPNLWRFWLLSQ